MKPRMKHKVGDDIYVRSSYYISNGSNDFTGGLCKIARIKFHDGTPFVEVIERPGWSYNYLTLLEEQPKLAEQFGKLRGRQIPDVNTPWIEPGDVVGDERGCHIADYAQW